MFIVQDFELLPSFSRVSSPEGPDRSQSYQPTGHRGPGGFSLASLGQRGRTGCISDTFPGALGSLLTLFHGLYYPSPLFSNAPPHGPLFCFYLLTAQSQQPRAKPSQSVVRFISKLLVHLLCCQSGQGGPISDPNWELGGGPAQIESKAHTVWV